MKKSRKSFKRKGGGMKRSPRSAHTVTGNRRGGKSTYTAGTRV